MMNEKEFVDVSSTVQILGNIFNNPNILNEGYTFVKDDFFYEFHRILFETFYNLNKMGVDTFNADIVEDCIQKNPKKIAIYKMNNGRDYLSEVSELANPEAFDFYYNRFKRFSLLRAYVRAGFDVSEIYNPNSFDILETSKQEERLNSMSLKEISNVIKAKMEDIEISYLDNSSFGLIQAGRNGLEYLEKYKKTPQVGIPLYGAFINTIVRGARLKKFYLRSAPSGVGKSRSMIADSCYIGCDEMYDLKTQSWVSIGPALPVLYITTELDEEEVTAMQISFLSGVQEEKFLLGELSNEEEIRVVKAIEILNRSKVSVEYMLDYGLSDIENCIKTANRKKGIRYFVFDYIHSTQKILSQVSDTSKVAGLQEYQVLFLIATKLKDLCNQLDIFLLSSTQLNGDYRTAKIFDQNLLRGSKATADKIDVGSIMLNVTQEDLDKLEPIIAGYGIVPNYKMSVYKNRGGKYKDILVWGVADKGICRFNPVFITSYQYELLEDIPDTKIKVEEK